MIHEDDANMPAKLKPFVTALLLLTALAPALLWIAYSSPAYADQPENISMASDPSCPGDLEGNDQDTDGADLAVLALNMFQASLEDVAFSFGGTTCSISLGVLDTIVSLVADNGISPSAGEIVTFGLPLAPGILNNTDDLHIQMNNVELAIHVESGLTWHFRDGSLRSVTIQVRNIDMTGGPQQLRIRNIGRDTSMDLTKQPIENGWTTAGPDRNFLPHPRIFALHEKAYLADTQLIPPYQPALDTGDDFTDFVGYQFDSWASANFDYSASTRANWLFDRPTAMFKQYMATGELKYLKEAFLSKQFYWKYVRNEGVPVAPQGGDGCWLYDGGACADGKYIYPESAKLSWALTGDTTQWNAQLITNMALQADLGWNQHFTRGSYVAEIQGFTERSSGLTGLAEINSYEITGDPTILAHLNERIDYLKDMQQTPKQWDIDNGWLPMPGYFRHSWGVHEGDGYPGDGDRNDRRGSPWMSENITDFLWHVYWSLNHPEVPEILRRLANAVDLYGFTTSYSAESDTYIPKEGISEVRAVGYNTQGAATDPFYSMSDIADIDQLEWNWYTDTHTEIAMVLAAGAYFETDSVIKHRVLNRANLIKQGWSNYNCGTFFGGTRRMFNWQHRSNGIRTLDWVTNYNSEGSP